MTFTISPDYAGHRAVRARLAADAMTRRDDARLALTVALAAFVVVFVVFL